MTRVAIVDYGMGNLHSVARALQHVAPNAQITISQSAAQVAAADRVVFPGQGAMPDCMQHLEQAGLRDAVLNAAKSKPLLGICIGEQMLFTHSAEGDTPGLALLEGQVLHFEGSQFAPHGSLKVPHMGWNRVTQAVAHPLWAQIEDQSYFYFVHSFYVSPTQTQLSVGLTDYGFSFTSAVAQDNVFATQFHPEKSAKAGLQLLANFVHWNP